MNEGRISTRYARALLATHTARGDARAVYDQAQSLAGVLRQGADDVAKVLLSPLVSSHDKQRFVMHLVQRVAPSLQPFAELMFSRGRGAYFQRALLVFLDLYRKQERVVWAEVSVTHPLGEAQLQRVSGLLGQTFPGHVELSTRIDPELIGGFRLEVDGYVCDRSVRGELDRLRRELS